MDRKQLNVFLCSILTTLDEMPGGWGPRSHIMLGCGMEYDTFLFVERIMTEAGLVVATSEMMTITEKGREIARQVREHLKNA